MLSAAKPEISDSDDEDYGPTIKTKTITKVKKTVTLSYSNVYGTIRL